MLKKLVVVVINIVIMMYNLTILRIKNKQAIES